MRPTKKVLQQKADYAMDVQNAIHGVMLHYRETVGLESQVAIMGVAIGAILHQLPRFECDHFMGVLIEHMRDAPQLSEPIPYVH